MVLLSLPFISASFKLNKPVKFGARLLLGNSAHGMDECLTPVGLQEPPAPGFVLFYTHVWAGHTVAMQRILKVEGARKG